MYDFLRKQKLAKLPSKQVEKHKQIKNKEIENAVKKLESIVLLESRGFKSRVYEQSMQRLFKIIKNIEKEGRCPVHASRLV